MRRITKAQAVKLFNQKSKPVTLCPCKMRPEGPFSMGTLIFGQEWFAKAEQYKTHPDLWKGSLETTAWALMYNNWSFYNSNNECGYYPHYYVEK